MCIKSSELLAEAKRTLGTKVGYSYICNEIKRAAQTLKAPFGVAKAIIIQIEADMAATNSEYYVGDTYSGWYCANYKSFPSDEDALIARHQWLDALIVYYQSKGD